MEAVGVYFGISDSAINGTCVLYGTYVWGVASPWDFDLSNDAVITLSGVYTGMGNFTIGSSGVVTGVFNLASGSTVISKGADINGATINGDCNIESATVTSFSNLTVTGVMDFDTAGTYTIDACTLNIITNSSGGAVTLLLVNSPTIATNTGPNIALIQNVDVVNTGLLDGTRVQLYNITQAAELDNSVVSGGTGYSFEVNLLSASVNDGHTLRLRATYTNGCTAK